MLRCLVVWRHYQLSMHLLLPQILPFCSISSESYYSLAELSFSVLVFSYKLLYKSANSNSASVSGSEQPVHARLESLMLLDAWLSDVLLLLRVASNSNLFWAESWLISIAVIQWWNCTYRTSKQYVHSTFSLQSSENFTLRTASMSCFWLLSSSLSIHLWLGKFCVSIMLPLNVGYPSQDVYSTFSSFNWEFRYIPITICINLM